MTATPQDTASQDTASTQPGAAFPDTGTPAADLLAKIRADRPGDIDWKHGKTNRSQSRATLFAVAR